MSNGAFNCNWMKHEGCFLEKKRIDYVLLRMELQVLRTVLLCVKFHL